MRLFAAAFCFTLTCLAQNVTYDRLLHAVDEPGNWLMYGGDYRSHHYSSLKQITSENIERLHPAWIYQMHRSKVETTPIVVDGIMYVTRPPILFAIPMLAQNPYTGTADIAEGKRIFAARCGACHGQAGEGGRGPALNTSALRSGGSDRELFLTIRNGVPNTEMPRARKNNRSKGSLTVASEPRSRCPQRAFMTLNIVA